MSKHGTSSSIISYIMFATLPGSEPDWVLEVYVRRGIPGNEPDYGNNVYLINRLGNIDSLSPSSGIRHVYEAPKKAETSYRVFHFNNRKYYGHAWIHVTPRAIDELVFSNLTEQENNKLVTDIKGAITEVLL